MSKQAFIIFADTLVNLDDPNVARSLADRVFHFMRPGDTGPEVYHLDEQSINEALINKALRGFKIEQKQVIDNPYLNAERVIATMFADTIKSCNAELLTTEVAGRYIFSIASNINKDFINAVKVIGEFAPTTGSQHLLPKWALEAVVNVYKTTCAGHIEI